MELQVCVAWVDRRHRQFEGGRANGSSPDRIRYTVDFTFTFFSAKFEHSKKNTVKCECVTRPHVAPSWSDTKETLACGHNHYTNFSLSPSWSSVGAIFLNRNMVA